MKLQAGNMEHLKELMKRRKEVGKVAVSDKNFRNSYVELHRLDGMIAEQTRKLFDESRLVILPLAIEQKAYVIVNDHIIEDIVEDYDIWSVKDGIKLRIRLKTYKDYVIGAYGKDVFSDEEGAKEALLERNERNI